MRLTIDLTSSKCTCHSDKSVTFRATVQITDYERDTLVEYNKGFKIVGQDYTPDLYDKCVKEYANNRINAYISGEAF